MKALRSVKTFVAFVLTLTTIALLPVNTVGAAGNDGNYVSEVYIAYGKDEEAAEKVLRDKGFTPIKKRYDNQVNNINTKGETGAAHSYWKAPAPFASAQALFSGFLHVSSTDKRSSKRSNTNRYENFIEMLIICIPNNHSLYHLNNSSLLKKQIKKPQSNVDSSEKILYNHFRIRIESGEPL